MNGYDLHSLSFRESSGDLPSGITTQTGPVTRVRRDNRAKRNHGWRPEPFRDAIERHGSKAASEPKSSRGGKQKAAKKK